MEFSDFLESIHKVHFLRVADANLFSTPDAPAHIDISFPCTPLECASRHILMRKIIARDMVPESQAKKRKSSNFIGFTWDFHLNWHCTKFGILGLRASDSN
jgi:hypothetical protein